MTCSCRLFPLFSVLAATAFPPKAMDEALVAPYQLVVGLINSIAPHQWLADVLPSFLKLFSQCGQVTAALASEDHATLTERCHGTL